MRHSHVLLVSASVVALVGCKPGPQTPKAAAQAFLEATLRGDEQAARKLIVAPAGVSREVVDLTLHARLARARAKSRVAQAAVKRFGPEAEGAFPVSWNVTDELRALDSAPVEGDAEKAVIPVGRKPLVVRRVGMAWWKSWKVEIDPARSEQEQQRMRAHATAVDEAADATIRGIERGEYSDARAASEAFLRRRLEHLQQAR